jgi:signal transduction histidine kinase
MHPRFVPALGDVQATDLLADDGTLLAATAAGVYALAPGRPAVRVTTGQAFQLFPRRGPEAGTYAATAQGVTLLSRVPGSGWQHEAVAGVAPGVRALYETEGGAVWVSDATGGVYRLGRLLPGAGPEAASARYGAAHGLPAAITNIVEVGGAPAFLSPDGAWRLADAEPAGDADGVRFAAAPALVPEGEGPLRALVEGRGQAWAVRGRAVYRRAAGDTSWQRVRAVHVPAGRTVGLFPERAGPEAPVWLSDGTELVGHDPAADAPPPAPPTVVVRQVTDPAEGRALVPAAMPIMAAAPATAAAPSLPFRHRLRFDVAVPRYALGAPVAYRFRVNERGGWSDWGAEAHAFVHGLWEGAHALDVRVRLPDGVVHETRLPFRLLPPWYRTWWAYAGYLLLAVGFVVAGRHYARLQAASREAEQRSRELAHAWAARARLEEANDRLTEANARLQLAESMREDFLANLSHELRTPLTGIIGFAEVLREEGEEETQTFAESIWRSGKRLLRTLNALMDMAALRAGQLTPEIKRTDVTVLLRSVAAPYERVAEQQGLALHVALPTTPLHARLDTEYAAQILRSLLENAFAFTDEGYVALVAHPSADGEEVVLAVRDTGCGMDAAFLDDVFTAFRQESEGRARTHEGTGLSLAVAYRLAKLMGGTLEVESTVGVGSTFRLRLPRAGGDRGGTGRPPPGPLPLPLDADAPARGDGAPAPGDSAPARGDAPPDGPETNASTQGDA